MKKILVVEDSAIIRGKYFAYLNSAGHEVYTAVNGKEAVEKVGKEPLDLILMDIIMPVMDGFEAIRRIREIESLPFIPIIVISGVGSSDSIKKALNLGADEYIVKPTDEVAFNARVKAMLHLKDLYEQAKTSDQKYELLLQALPDIVYKLDLNGNFVFISDSVKTIGYDPHEIIGRHFSELIHADDLPQVSSALILPRLSGKDASGERTPKLFDERRGINRATRNLEVRLAERDFDATEGNGSATTVMVTIAFSEVASAGQFDPKNNEVIGTVGIIRDVSERKEAEQNQERLIKKLQAAEQELEIIKEKIEEKPAGSIEEM